MLTPNYEAPSSFDDADSFTYLHLASAQAMCLRIIVDGYLEPHLMQQQVTSTTPPE